MKSILDQFSPDIWPPPTTTIERLSAWLNAPPRRITPRPDPIPPAAGSIYLTSNREALMLSPLIQHCASCACQCPRSGKGIIGTKNSAAFGSVLEATCSSVSSIGCVGNRPLYCPNHQLRKPPPNASLSNM